MAGLFQIHAGIVASPDDAGEQFAGFKDALYSAFGHDAVINGTMNFSGIDDDPAICPTDYFSGQPCILAFGALIKCHTTGATAQLTPAWARMSDGIYTTMPVIRVSAALPHVWVQGPWASLAQATSAGRVRDVRFTLDLLSAGRCSVSWCAAMDHP